MSASAKPRTCTVDGCGAKTHGRGLCRNRYDERRYLATPAVIQRPGASCAGTLDRDRALPGKRPELGLPHGNGSMFATHEGRRGNERREALMQEYADRGLLGHRPWAWWHYFAERPQHVIDYDDYRRSAEGNRPKSGRTSTTNTRWSPCSFSRP